MLAIVDSPEAARVARSIHGPATIATDNPMLAFAEGIQNIDGLVSQALTNQLGLAAIEFAEDVSTQLAPFIDADRMDTRPPLSISRAVRVLAASLFYRAAVFAKAIETHAKGPVSLFVAKGWNGCGNSGIDPGRFAHPFPALVRAGFLGSREYDVKIIEAALPQSVNDTASGSLVARAALLPRRLVVQMAIDRLGTFAGLRRSGQYVPVIGDSEILREAAPEIRRAGYRPVHYKSVSQSAKPEPPATQDKWRFRPATQAAVHRAATSVGTLFSKEQLCAIESVVTDALVAAAPWMSQVIRAGEAFADRVHSECEAPRVALTSAMSHLACGAFHRRANQLGMTVLLAEHGVSKGLAELSASTVSSSEINNCDTFLAISDRAAMDIKAAGGSEGRDYVVVGLPEHVRRLQNARLQRRVARRRLAIGHKETVVFHVSPLPFYGNQRPGHLVASETSCFDIERRFKCVYDRLDKRVVFKSYPTQRLPFHPPLAEVLPRSPRIDPVSNEDFRYLRGAADIIVTGTPTSTLGWCLGAGVPVIWWHSRAISPALPDITEALRGAIFTLDLDAPDWEDELTSLLMSPKREIDARWQEKRRSRDRILEAAIFGPLGSPGARIARAVCAAHGQSKGAREMAD